MKKIIVLVMCIFTVLSVMPFLNAADATAWSNVGNGRARLDFIEVKDGVALANVDLGGLTVTEIGEEACAYADITSVEFPPELKIIGKSAFAGNDMFVKIDIPLSVEYIGDYAFSGCDAEEITLSENVSHIGESALGAVGTVHVIKDSYAHKYCVDNGLNFILDDEGCEHSLKEDVTVAYPTCTDSGEVARQCAECGKLFERAEVKAIGHSYDNWDISDGVRTRNCSGCLNTFSGFASPADALPFTDLNESAWYIDSIGFCYANSVINGMSPIVFSPDTNTTRAMVVRILANYAGVDVSEYSEAPFTDVPKGSWFTPAIAWASEAGIVNGYGSTFGPDDNITREQLSLIMKKFAAYMQYKYDGATADLSVFTDADSISEWAKDGVEWAVSQGIVNGMGNGTMLPGGHATRAQLARMIMMLADKFESSEPMYDRVVVFCIDGAGNYFKNANTPNIDRIFDISADSTAEIPTRCTENWASILYGVPADLHKIGNSNIAGNTGSFTTFLGLAAKAYPDELVASFTADHKISKYIVENDLGIYTTDQENVYDNTLADMLTQEGGYLETNDPKLLFVEMRQSEQGAAHFEGGYDGDRYRQQLSLTDGYIGQIYNKYESLNRTERTLFLLITDHGGVKGSTSSGGSGEDEITTMFAAAGYNVNKDAEINDMKNRDVFAIVAKALNIDIPNVCDSVCPKELFVEE